MAIESKHHRDDHVRATSSEGSRRDASGIIPEPRFESYADELRYLKATVASLEVEIAAYSSAQQTKEQMRIRTDGKPNSLNRWLRKKVEMDDKRKQLTARKSEMVARIIQIKPRVSHEAQKPVDPGKEESKEQRIARTNMSLTLALDQLVQEAQQSNRLLTQILELLQNQTSNDEPSAPSRT